MRALAAFVCVFLGFVARAAVQRAEINFEYVRDLAVKRAAEPYRAPEARLPPRIAKLTYDDYRKIEFRRDHALWGAGGLPFQVQLFPRGGLFTDRVTLHEFSRTHVQVVPFDAAHFKLGDIPDLPALPDNLGYAGFKLLHPLNRPDAFDEVSVFLGASYFRALGAGQHYGLSARGLALDSGRPDRAEEFPRFSEFWLGKPEPKSPGVTVYALLEGPSVAGAFEFIVTPGKATFTDIRAALIFRAVGKLPGFAPLTSMYWYGENTRRPEGHMRPEVHDSDGLFVRDGEGVQSWRPLRNPTAPVSTEIPVERLSRFGLAQRDRHVQAYEDREAQYERRPTAWVQPRDGWGAGAVHLVELPTTNEYADNIVAYWVPRERPLPGAVLELNYRLTWASVEPADAPPARVIATREGARPGDAQGRLFWIDFVDPKAAERLPGGATVEADVSAGGRLARLKVERYAEIGGWRAALEIEPTEPAKSPMELRCRLRDKEGVFSEIWLYQWKP